MVTELIAVKFFIVKMGKVLQRVHAIDYKIGNLNKLAAMIDILSTGPK
jgi:hypothetical protein